MAKFILGAIAGALLSLAYVHYNVALPGALQLPERLRGALISTATETQLYDLDADPAQRRRALEVFFTFRAPDAVKIDAQAGFPFLMALEKHRATREARQLLLAASAFRETLEKAALRAALERKHGTQDTAQLQLRMLEDALNRKPFLKRWLEKHDRAVQGTGLIAALAEAARQ
ncbi:MAG: hypothetical protein R3D67_14825 [Hyphomicrobiaceae bacterium]